MVRTVADVFRIGQGATDASDRATDFLQLTGETEMGFGESALRLAALGGGLWFANSAWERGSGWLGVLAAILVFAALSSSNGNCECEDE